MSTELLIASTKRAWHAALVADPTTHAWVLNLYRAGERHPEQVTDYFPIDDAPSEALREQMIRHRSDEARHAQLYERAVKLLDQPLEEPDGLDVFNNAIRHCTGAPFAIEAAMTRAQRTERVVHFLCHAHFLEKRIARSLQYHAEACQHGVDGGVRVVVESVLADEERHCAYTRHAPYELVPRRTADAAFAHHEAAERRANLLFSARQVRTFLRRFPQIGRRRDRLRFAAGAVVMDLLQGGLALV